MRSFTTELLETKLVFREFFLAVSEVVQISSFFPIKRSSNERRKKVSYERGKLLSIDLVHREI
jgi:hypothetical protein